MCVAMLKPKSAVTENYQLIGQGKWVLLKPNENA